MNLKSVAGTLTKKYPWNICDLGATKHSQEWAFRYLVKAVLVTGGSDSASEDAIEAIFKKYPTIASVAEANSLTLGKLIADAGVRFHPRKAENIIAIAKFCHQNVGVVPSDRYTLESLPGVGRHVASVFCATVFGEPEFAVDLHVKRVLSRMNFVRPKDNDIVVENAVTGSSLDRKQLGHFSRALVDFGQDICGKTPQCGRCPFVSECKGAIQAVTKTAKLISVQIQSGSMQVPSSDGSKNYTVSFHNGVGSCTCTANRRFKKQCSHIATARG